MLIFTYGCAVKRPFCFSFFVNLDCLLFCKFKRKHVRTCLELSVVFSVPFISNTNFNAHNKFFKVISTFFAGSDHDAKSASVIIKRQSLNDKLFKMLIISYHSNRCRYFLSLVCIAIGIRFRCTL